MNFLTHEAQNEFAHIAGVLIGRHGLTRHDLTDDTGQRVYLPTYGVYVYVKKPKVKNDIQSAGRSASK